MDERPAAEEHYRRLERMYAAAPIHRFIRMRIEVADSEARVLFDATEKLHHAARTMHGSMYFKALDDAAFFAVASIVPDAFVLTRQFGIDLLRPVATGALRAEGRVTHDGGKSFLADAVLYDARGRQLARGSGSFRKGTTPWTETLGYGD